MKKLRFYKVCLIAFCLIALSACSYFTLYDVIEKRGGPEITISSSSVGHVLDKFDTTSDKTGFGYHIRVDTDSSFIANLDKFESEARLLVADSVYIAKIQKSSNYTNQAFAEFRGISRDVGEKIAYGLFVFWPKSDRTHFIELRFKSGDSIDYYYKFKNQE